MKKKSFSYFLAFIIVIGTTSSLLSVSGNSIETEFVRHPIDIGPELRSRTISQYPEVKKSSLSNHLGPTAAQEEDYYQIGDVLEWYALDDYNPEVEDGIFTTEFELRAIGELCEIWVQTDLSFPDSRDTPIITDEQVNSYLEVFETNIYPTDTYYFGEPDFHNGTYAENGDYYEESTGRNVILVSNIRDESYYDPNYPYYVVGFYWGVFEDAFDRNIVSIDAEGWENEAAMEFYEGTLAHEYQHLIHDDYNPDDPSFMNEGCSMYAEPLCGYDIPWGDIEAYLATPDNSLIEWSDQGGINILADYGQAFLWAAYLSDHYGGADFLSYFVKSGIPGIAGINNALAHFRYVETFNDVYLDWSIANLLHTDSIGGGKYNYHSFDLNTLDADATRIYEVKPPYIEQTGVDFGETKSYLNDRTSVYKLGSYGADYIQFGNIHDRFTSLFDFDGDDFAEQPMWRLVDEDGDGDLEWYSTAAAPESDISIMHTIDLSEYSTNPILSIETKYAIEAEWDFGFIQLSTDYGETWISLDNAYTSDIIDPDGYPAISENLPGLSGDSAGWISMDFDLSAFAGETVQLRFRYMTDWATEEPGWWVDNIAIDGIILDNADNIVNFVTPPPIETDFFVTLISGQEIDGILEYREIETILLDDVTESLTTPLNLADYVSSDEFLYLIVSPTMGLADYQFSIIKG